MTSIDRSRKHEFTAMGELYNWARPSYPPALFRQLDNHFNFETGETTLEIGSGTGKATERLAARGLTVTGIDIAPDLLVVAGIRGHGSTVLLVEQNAHLALSIGDRGYVLETGRLVRKATRMPYGTMMRYALRISAAGRRDSVAGNMTWRAAENRVGGSA